MSNSSVHVVGYTGAGHLVFKLYELFNCTPVLCDPTHYIGKGSGELHVMDLLLWNVEVM